MVVLDSTVVLEDSKLMVVEVQTLEESNTN